MQRQRRQVRRLATTGLGIQAREFIQQQVQRPTIGDDMVQGDPELVFLLIQAHQADPQQRAMFKVERLPRLDLTLLRGRLVTLACRQPGEVDPLPGEFALRLDTLQGHAITFEKTRAQRLVTLDQALEAGAQGHLVQLAAQTQTSGNVVGGALRVDLPGQPQALLRRRLRQIDATRQLRHRCLWRNPFGQLLGDCRGEGLQGRRLE